MSCANIQACSNEGNSKNPSNDNMNDTVIDSFKVHIEIT